ncbi:hypothetical protein BDV06DRAFT_216182 [Aspergillus oleicola]
MPRSRRGNSVSSSGTSPKGPPQPSTTIPQQTFPLATPPPKSTSNKCIRLSPRLLLQIQQLQTSTRSRATRAIPILELYQPPTFGKTIALPPGSASTDGGENGRGCGNATRKVHGKDLYLTQSEDFAHLRRRTKKVGFNENGNGYTNGNSTKPRSGFGGSNTTSTASRDGTSSSSGSGPSSGDESERRAKFRPRRKSKNALPAPPAGQQNGEEEGEEAEDNVVAIIHTSPKPRSKEKDVVVPDAELLFSVSGMSFDATCPGSGQYKFDSSSSGAEKTSLSFTWEKRPPSRTGEKDEGDRFVLLFSHVSDTSGETTSLTKKPCLAQLTRRGIHVCGLEGDALAGGSNSRWAALDGQGQRGGQGAGLYTLILTSAVWVARREGWV